LIHESVTITATLVEIRDAFIVLEGTSCCGRA
jgi:hypothetical protein